jgi:hypothetical protein
VWATARHRFGPSQRVAPFDGDPRVGIVTVNRSTTRYLKLMLLTLAEQEQLDIVHRVVIVDNGSKDGGGPFLGALESEVEPITVVRNRWFLNHARGVRRGLRELPDEVNVVLACDTDVIFRDPTTIFTVASLMTVHDAALVGELRDVGRRYPDIQASFLAMRRDWLARRDVKPWVNHGSPALWLEESVWTAGGTVVDLASNRGGYILHRGRTAVQATSEYDPRSSYATARVVSPHYMGVPDGAEIWAEAEARWADWLRPENESRVLEHLAQRFSRR